MTETHLLKQPRILIISGSPPGRKGVGQIIVGDICSMLRPNIACFFATLARNETWSPEPEFQNLPVKMVTRRYEHGIRPLPGMLGHLAKRAGFHGMFRPHIRRLISDAIAWGRQHQCTAVLSILESATNIEMANAVATGLGIPTYSLIWDSPEHLVSHLGQNPFSLERLNATFADAVRGSKRMAVVSENMQRRYEAEFGVEAVIVRHAATCMDVRAQTFSDARPFVIGYAGSVTAKPQMDLLLKALRSVNWTLGRRSVEVVLYGMRFVLEADASCNIRFAGYHDTNEVVRHLAAETDALYLPQCFEKQSLTYATMSFPTKFSTYAAARRPILLHAPPESTVGPVLSRYSMGIWCQDMTIATLVTSLTELATNRDFHEAAVRGCQIAVEQEFNPAHFRAQLHSFLDIGPEWQPGVRKSYANSSSL